MKKLLFALALLVALPATASAHSGLVSANPAANVEITLLPQVIELAFTEELIVIGDSVVNTISLIDPTGAPIALSDIAVTGATLSATIPEANYPSGSYRVEYKIVSADGHKLSESYNFTLNAPTLLALPTEASEEANEATNEATGGNGVIPLPIVGAIAIVVALGGFFALRARKK